MFREEKAKNCVERKELLGTGSFGSVYRGDWLQAIDGKRKEVAVKIVPYSGNDIDQLGRELYFLKRFNSPFTVGYFDSFFSHSELWILMEICDSGSLLDIYRSSEKSLTEAELRAVIACSALGLLHVHEQQAIHRDIKAGNILLCSSGKVMLSDFGVSTKLTDTLQRRNTVIGTPYWMAPEILLESSYTENVDVWSLGVTMLEMAEKKPPHNGVKPISAMFLITYKPAPTLAEPNKWSTEMHHFLSRCLIKDPNFRASSKEIAEHAWIKKEVAILRQCQINNQNCSLPVLIELAKRNVETIRQNRLKIIEAYKDDDNYGDSVEMVMEDEDMCTETWDDKRNPRPRGGSVERNDFIKRAWQTKHFNVSHAKESPLEESMRLKTEGVDYNNSNGMSKVTEIVKELNSPRTVYTAALANDNMKTAGTNDTFVYKRPVVGDSNSDKTPVKKNSIILLNNSDHNKNNNNNNNPPSSRSPITKQQYQAQQMKGRGGISNSNHNKTNGDDDDDTVELNNAQTQALRMAITQVNNDSDKNGNDGTVRMGQFDVAVATALAASNNNIPIKTTANNNKTSNKTTTAAITKLLQPDADTVFLLRQLDKLSAYDSARTNTSDKDDNNNNNNDDSASGRRSSTSSNGDSNNRPLNRIGRSSTVSSCSSNHNTLKPSGGYGNNNNSGVSPAKPRRKSFVIEIPDKFTGVVERLTHILDRMDDFTGMNSPRYNMNNANANNNNNGAATAAAVPRREFKEVPLPTPPPISQSQQSKNEYKASAKTTSSSINSSSPNNSSISGSKGTAATTSSAAAKTTSPTINSTTAAAAKTTANTPVVAAAKITATTASAATSSTKAVAGTTTNAGAALSLSAEAKTTTTKSTTASAATTTAKSVAPTSVLKTTTTTKTNNNNTNTTTTATSVSPLRSAANSVSAAASTFFKSSATTSSSTAATAGTGTTERPKTTASVSSSSSGMGTMSFTGFLDGRRRTSSAALPVHSSATTTSSTGAATTVSERVLAMSTATDPVSSTERRYSTTAVPLTSSSNRSTAAIPPSTVSATTTTTTTTTTTATGSNNITKPSQVSLRTTPKPPSY